MRCTKDATINHRNDVDDRARLAGVAPISSGGLHHVPGAEKVVVDDSTKTIGRHVYCRLRKLAARIVDHKIQLPMGFSNPVEQCRHIFIASDVGGHSQNG